ncbi:substrate-binding periplasmic protein [Kiloniella sp.]|uniref:substrate-binding periplasmic protein n=1 Tax=Kiloniella sp. TaxID=1938587 RepID=UPI003B02A7D6
MIRINLYTLLYLVLLISISEPSVAAQDVVKVCGEEYPPYSFSKTDDKGQPTRELTGATVDFFEEASKQSHFDFQITLMPWAGCVASVANYKGEGDFEMFIDATSNSERLAKFLPSDAMYKTQNGLFYSYNKFSEKLSDISIKTLEGKTFCGLLGNNQEWLTKLGIPQHLINYDFTNLSALFKQTRAGYCDFAAYSFEIVMGQVFIKKLALSDDINFVEFPKNNGQANLFYHWVSKSSPSRQQIIEILNRQKVQLEGGAYENIYRRYLPNGSGLQ